MAFVARKPFVFKGVHYRPGEVVHGFPQDFFRAEGFIRSGMIVEAPDMVPEEVKPVEDVVEGETLEAEEPAPEPEEAPKPAAKKTVRPKK
jgi:hypothetical protein